MLKILLTSSFKKRLRQRITTHKLKKKYQQRLKLFMSDPHHPFLRNHKPTGNMKGKRAFSISGDIRLVYQEMGSETMEFLDIGTHTQIYGE